MDLEVAVDEQQTRGRWKQKEKIYVYKDLGEILETNKNSWELDAYREKYRVHQRHTTDLNVTMMVAIFCMHGYFGAVVW